VAHDGARAALGPRARRPRPGRRARCSGRAYGVGFAARMRSLFALLVLGNIALAGWYVLRPAPPAAASSRALDVPSIELVGEWAYDARRATATWTDKSGPWERRDGSTPRA